LAVLSPSLLTPVSLLPHPRLFKPVSGSSASISVHLGFSAGAVQQPPLLWEARVGVGKLLGDESASPPSG
jgi:hypothetical protein